MAAEQLNGDQLAEHNSFPERVRYIVSDLANKGRVFLAGSIALAGSAVAMDHSTSAYASTGQAEQAETGVDPGDFICQVNLGEQVCVYGTPKGLIFRWTNAGPYPNTEQTSFKNVLTSKPYLQAFNWTDSSTKTYTITLPGGEYSGDVTDKDKAYQFNLYTGSQGVTPPPATECKVGETSPPGGTPVAMMVFVSQGCESYDVVTADGNVITFGSDKSYGNLWHKKVDGSVVDGEATPDGKGYWLLTNEGGVYTFGDAKYYGSAAGKKLGKTVIGMAVSPDGKGYTIASSEGGVYTFGDAKYYGSAIRESSQPITGLAITSGDEGYYLVNKDGNVYAFGDARNHGPKPGALINKPIVGLQTDHYQGGYREVSAEGNVYAFWAASSIGGAQGRITSPVVGMENTPDSLGYYLFSENGKIYAFGDAKFIGSTAPTV